MFNLEGLIPKLCQLAQEMGDDERSLRLRPAGMQALAFMVMVYTKHVLYINGCVQHVTNQWLLLGVFHR